MSSYRTDFGEAADAAGPDFAARALSWIPTVMFAYAMVVAPLFVWNAGGDDINITASQSNMFNQLFWLGIFVVTLCLSLARLDRLPAALANPVAIIICCYLVLSAFSVLWSPVPGIAIRRLILQAILLLCLILSVGMADSRQAILNRLTALVVFTVAVNVVAVALIPPSPIGYEGIYPQKNGLGAVMAFSILILLHGVFEKKGMLRMVLAATLGAAFVLLVMSESKTSLGLVIIIPVIVYALVTVAYHLRINAFVLFMLLSAIAVVMLVLVSAVIGFGFDDMSMVLFNDTTFTGRTIIWEFVLDVVSRSWLLGQGYSSFWGIGVDSVVFRQAPSFVPLLLQAHNGYLDILVETGVIGFSLLLALIFFSMRAVSNLVQADRRAAQLCMMLILLAVLHNMLESSWFRSFSQIWIMFVLAALMPGLPSRPRAADREERR